ncbi:hypothetical protein [Atopomonas hussainii]|uniref:hypothetical protein n=1 Tax=Atopomonas hussainii TaxID=1429083 RepID=UPI00090018D1|nr:hypothetical protein [Atopomonas hussainii]
MEVATFKAACAACGQEFLRPELSDFAYGDFILCTKSGSDFAHFSVIENPACKLVEPQLPKGVKLTDVMASLADPVSEEPLVSYPVCPTCQSSKLAFWRGEQSGKREVLPATFTQFLELSISEQQLAVQEAVRRVAA